MFVNIVTVHNLIKDDFIMCSCYVEAVTDLFSASGVSDAVLRLVED